MAQAIGEGEARAQFAKLRSQSAMEYLMTYGWSILIIAVVLGALFGMGVFNSANFAPKAQPGNCKVLRTGGTTNLVGTCTGTLPQSVAQFDGIGSVIAIADSSSLDNGGSESVSLWFKASNLISGGIFQHGTCSGGFYIGMQNTLGIVSSNPTSQWVSQAIQANTWYHVVYVWQSTGGSTSNVIFYLNGAQTAIHSLTAGTFAIGSPIKLGRLVSAGCWGDGSLSGSEADIQQYNTTLDASQVQALYLKGIGAAPVDPNHIVGWWPLNGDANDYSGNNNGGAPTNIIYTSSWTGGYTPP
jgi:Concanavalin A-like lectin/glucanases superfamily